MASTRNLVFLLPIVNGKSKKCKWQHTFWYITILINMIIHIVHVVPNIHPCIPISDASYLRTPWSLSLLMEPPSRQASRCEKWTWEGQRSRGYPGINKSYLGSCFWVNAIIFHKSEIRLILGWFPLFDLIYIIVIICIYIYICIWVNYNDLTANQNLIQFNQLGMISLLINSSSI